MFIFVEIGTLIFTVAVVLAILLSLHSWQRRIWMREQGAMRGFPITPKKDEVSEGK